MCTRIVVLKEGQVASELGGEGLTEHALVNAIEGERSADGANNAI
jgi:ABC-type sugar transport system ATPase subunit